jgi:uncharacterized protein (DUF488 family)
MIPQPKPEQCYTIGYGNYPFDRFVSFLREVSIELVIDVRSSPYSRFNPHFNRGTLEKSLNLNDIGYCYLGDKIGGRYSDPKLLFPDGTVDYRKVRATQQFQDGINEVLSIISGGKMTVLMCAEKEPEKCHRFALISRDLQSRGIRVVHIRPESGLQENEDLEKELINLLVDKRQKTFSPEPVDYADLMYGKLNRKMGTGRAAPVPEFDQKETM